MGTITTYGHCLVYDSITYTGTKRDIVGRCYDYYKVIPTSSGFDVECKIKHRVPIKIHSYSNEFTYEEVVSDVIIHLFNLLIRNGYKHYRDVGM
jgi:hypothetical protein